MIQICIRSNSRRVAPGGQEEFPRSVDFSSRNAAEQSQVVEDILADLIYLGLIEMLYEDKHFFFTLHHVSQTDR